ncbi:MAG TPA: hypothetical protein VFC46_03290 [Humisphaera sp.]|nr:hypothetical protein [Humisphaera sp.]
MKYRYGLYPRWHGDRQALYDFAIECSENSRMDSVVPLFAVDVCSTIRSECDDGQSMIWNDPRMYEKLKNVLDHSTYYGTSKSAIRHISSTRAAFFATTGHWNEARKAVDATDAPLDQAVVAAIVERMARDLRGMILANTGPTGANVLRAQKLHADGKREPALAIYRAALKSNKDPDALLHLNGLILNVQREIDFAAGKQVSLQPDARFTGIEGYKGRWNLNKEGGFVGVCTSQQRLRVVYPADFGDAWELKTEFGFGVHRATWDVAGVLLVMPAGKEDLGVVIQSDPAALLIRVGQSNDLAVAQAAVLPGINTMTVRRDGKMLTVLLNGQQLFSGPVLAHDPQHQARIGLGGNPIYRGDTVHYKSVTIHKLSLKA